MKHLILIALLLWTANISFQVLGQPKSATSKVINNTEQFARFSLSSQNREVENAVLVQRTMPFSSISISAEVPWQEGEIWFVDGLDTVYFSPDPHGEEGVFFSNLQVLKSPVNNVILYGKISLELFEAQVYYAPRLPKATEQMIQKQMLNHRLLEDFCGVAPKAISQAVWREGLRLPDEGRGFAQVKHLIVHHSAGANHDDDHLNTLRNIYLFHTNGRGWSDIGYNYIIAHDGTLYAGRDPEEGAQDDVIGAHFCGKNTGTMGVCVLGNYEEVKPSQQAVDKLKELLVWKAGKEGINPVQTATHKDVDNLVGLGGHRDGCSTACPGTFLYNELPTVREFVKDSLDEKLPTVMLITSSPDIICEGEQLLFSASGLTDHDIGWNYHWEVEGGTYEQPSNDSLIVKSIDNTEVTVRLRAESNCQKSFYQQLNKQEKKLPGTPILTAAIDTLIADDIPQSLSVYFEPVDNADTLEWTFTGENIFPQLYKNRIDLYISDETTSGQFSFYGKNNCGQGMEKTFYVAVQPQMPEEKPMLVYPNPVKGNFVYFQTNGSIQVNNIRVVDVQGKYLNCQVTFVGGNQWKIDVESLSAGLYKLLVDDQSHAFIMGR